MLRKITLAAACLAVIASTGCRWSNRNDGCGADRCGTLMPGGVIPGPIPNTAALPVDPAYTGGGQIAPYGGNVRGLPAAAPAPYRGPFQQNPPAEPRETRRLDIDI